MRGKSRRDFVRSCLMAGGWVAPFMAWTAGCRRKPPVGERPTAVESAGSSARAGAHSGSAADAYANAGQVLEPGYLALHRSGQLKERGESLWKRMAPCKLCPRTCGVDRITGEKGFCQAGADLVISSHHPHFGEEPPLVGRKGSGTVFFSHCSLRCVFCINHEISLEGEGVRRTVEELAAMMLQLQKIGCHNLNFVTPSHVSPHIVLALDLAATRGLRLPVVWNTCGWEQLEILRLLDGVVDVYLADFKYACGVMAAKYSTCVPPDPVFLNSEAGERYTSTEIYPDLTKMALLEMHRQVGVAKPAPDGLMYRGLMIRHLVMPHGVSGSAEVMRWIAEHLPRDTYVNIMSQYQPTYRADEFPALARRITRQEYREAVQAARDAGLTNLEIQGEWRLG